MHTILRIVLVGLVATGTPAGQATTGPATAAPVVRVDGYVWADQPGTVDYTVTHRWAHNSTGGPIEIHRPSAGVYAVTFAGMGVTGGIAHVRPYGSGNTSICTIVKWKRNGDDEVLGVRCFDSAGAPADTLFVASFTNQPASAGDLAYLLADEASAPVNVPYTPVATYSYDSTGAATQVRRHGVGSYTMTIGAVDAHHPVDHHDGAYVVTAVNAQPVRCEVKGESGGVPTPVWVNCVDDEGNWTDSRFTVTYAHRVGLLGAGVTAANASFRYTGGDVSTFYLAGGWNAGGSPTLARLAVGRYRVTFPGLALTGGHVSAGAREDPWAYCHVAVWSPGSATVHCFNSVTDLPMDVHFSVLMTD
jgi:hypothetical protein